MTLINPISPLGPPVIAKGTVPAIVPFTMRESPSLLSIVEGMRVWMNDTLVPYINDNIQYLEDAWVEQVGIIIAEFERIAAELVGSVDEAKDAAEAAAAQAAAAQAAAEAAAALAEMFASQAEEIQDQAIAGIAGDLDSQTRTLLDSLYTSVDSFNTLELAVNALSGEVQNKADISVQETVETGRLSPSALNSVYARGVSVTAYGAIGDGLADDTEAVVNAISAVGSGGSVYFPPGVYSTNAFTIPSNVTLHGDRIATLICRSETGVYITINGSRAALSGLRIDGDNKVSNWLVDIARDSEDVLISSSELYNVTGAGTIALIRGRGGCNRLTVVDCFIHHANGTTVGRGILIGDTVGTVTGVKISDSTIEDIYPAADADGICIQDFTNRVDVGISDVTFRKNAKRAIKIQASGVRVDNCSIEIGDSVTPAYCGIAVYASDAIVRGNTIRGVMSVAFMDIGAAGLNVSNVKIVDNVLIGDLATRQSSCDGVRVQGQSIRNSVFDNQAYAVRHGFHFENIIKNVSISGIVDEATGSAVILDSNGLGAPENVVVPWLVIKTIANYAFHTNGGEPPSTMVIAGITGTANFGKFGGVIGAGVKQGFYEKNAIVKPTVSGVRGESAEFNSLMTRLVELGLVTDGRV